jgi:PhzF family phenazine biosynthesis protein
MQIPIYHVDAFTDEIFAGNPAAVCPLESWLPDDVLQKIAMENALSETAFFVPIECGYHIRWFTAEVEVDLCGHATLASAHVITRHLHPSLQMVSFQSQSGELIVGVEGDLLTLNFPSRPPEPCNAPGIILEAIPVQPVEVWKARDYMLVYEDEETVRNMQPNQSLLNQPDLNLSWIIVTAPGEQVDFVSRFFCPGASIFEDPVTGSAHCTLIPYWSERLGKTSLLARQVSARGGTLRCQNLGERVLISGQAVTYLEGRINI